MQKKHLFYTIALSLMLSVTLVGSVLLSQAASTLTAKVTFIPNKYDWSQPPPNPWKVSISVGWYRLIDNKSILLENVLAPVKTINFFFGFYAYFDGSAVRDIIGSKLAHVGSGITVVSLKITGKLRTGQTFAGEGTVTVTVQTDNSRMAFVFPPWEQQIVNGNLQMNLSFTWTQTRLYIKARINDDDYTGFDDLILVFDANGDHELDMGFQLCADNKCAPVLVSGNQLILAWLHEPSPFHTCIYRQGIGYSFNVTIPISKFTIYWGGVIPATFDFSKLSGFIYIRFDDSSDGHVYVSFSYKEASS